MRTASVAAVVLLAVAACGGNQTRPGAHDSRDELPDVEVPPTSAPDAGAWDGGSSDDGGAPDASCVDAGVRDAGYAFPPDVEWAYSVTGESREGVSDLLVHPDGHLLVVGSYNSWDGARIGDVLLPDMSQPDPEDYGDLWEDLFIAAFRPDGTRQWVHTYGGRYSDLNPTGAALDASGALYVTGLYWAAPDLGLGKLPYAYEPSLFLMKLSADGSRTEWVKTALASDHGASRPYVATSGDSVVWALSYTHVLTLDDGTTVDMGAGYGTLLVRYGTDGTRLAAPVALGGPQDWATARALALGPDGSVHLGLRGRGTLRVGGQDIQFPVATLAVVKLGPQGDYRWHKLLVDDVEDTYWARSLALATDAHGEVFLAGSYNGTIAFAGHTVRPARTNVYDVFVANLGPRAEERWLTTTSPDQSIRMESGGGLLRLQTWRNGEVALAGQFSSRLRLCGIDSTPEWEHTNAFLAVLGTDGACRYGRSFGPGDLYDAGMTMAQGQSDGEVYLGGGLQGTWPIRVQGVPCYRTDGRLCSWRGDGFFMRLRR